MKKAIFVWSGGKDSAFALYKVVKEKQFDVPFLLTTVNSDRKRISMHGVRESLLNKQAESIGIPLLTASIPEDAAIDVYEDSFNKLLLTKKNEGFDTCIFGDIFLEDIREYRIKQLEKVGYKAVFPLWKRNTKELIYEFVDSGFKTIVVCVDERYLDKSYVGKIIDKKFIDSLPENVDPCGENGEFHTFVFDGPVFRQPVKFETGEKVYRKYKSHSKENPDEENGFWFIDLY